MQISMQSPAAQRAIEAVIEHQTEAWNRKDAAAWVRDFAEDATFVNVRGDLVKGRAAIEKIHAFIFSGPYQKSPCATKVESVLFPAPGVAVVDTSNEVTNFERLPPGLVATAPGVFRTRMKMVLVNDQGTWKIQSAQNTAISPEPMAVER